MGLNFVSKRLSANPIVRGAKDLARIAKAQRSGEVKMSVVPGHFYSPIPSLREVEARQGNIFRAPEELTGLDLRSDAQLLLIAQLEKYYIDLPFKAEQQGSLRYYFENDYFSYGDGILLYLLLRHYRPRRVIEVGSGFSSAVMLDVNDLFFDGNIELQFVEPYPDRLNSLLRSADHQRVTVHVQPVQDMPVEAFHSLRSNDVIFIDSSHVSKVGSDVNYLFFNVLPQLEPGVLVHLHDIFYPFEYPKDWIFKGRAWNEAYLLRAFLTFNSAFSIVAFNSFLAAFHQDRVATSLPLWTRNPGGSLWMVRN